jgi:RNA polymerase sigma-70 factor (sigma-E family)
MGGPSIVATGVTDDVQAPAGAIEELYVRHVPAATRLAFLITGDEHVAEDIAQDAFLTAIGRFRHLRRPEAFDAYLRRAVVNRCRSRFRHARVEAAYVRRERGGVEPTVESDLGRRDELRAALSELPSRQRAAVVLRYYLDLSEEQAGDALRCSPAAVRSMVARAMGSLRAQISRSDEP